MTSDRIQQLGAKEIVVKDAIKKPINGITAAKDFITQAVSHEPHAALAWAGVSCLLPVSSEVVDLQYKRSTGLSRASR